MYLTYQMIMELKEMRRAQIVAGEKGTFRTVCWYSICEIVDYKHALYEDHLVFIAGIGMTDYKTDLMKMILYLIENGASGVVLEIGPYIKEVPAEICSLGEEKDFPILAIPYEVKISQVTYAMTQKIFERINIVHNFSNVLKELLCNKEVGTLDKAMYYGFKENAYGVVAIMEDNCLYEDDAELPEKFAVTILETYRMMRKQEVFWTKKDQCIYILCAESDEKELREFAFSMAENLQKNWHTKHYHWTISMGVGSLVENSNQLEKSIREAENALLLIRQCNRRNTVRFYEESGIYRLFYEYNDSSELQNIYENILGDLLDYDRKNQGDLMRTLENYLDVNCNIGAASEGLGIHRNTVKYRVKKIEEILNVDFLNNNQCFNLRLAFKIRKYLMIKQEISEKNKNCDMIGISI